MTGHLERAFTAALAVALVVALVMGADSESNKRVGIFEGKDTFLLPKGYREWIFVGSSLGLRYDENKLSNGAINSRRPGKFGRAP